MKQTMRYIVAMAAVLWMAIPQAKAQGVQEDHDPGIMYIMRNEGGHIPFQEGNEWEITFTAIDTLGNEYYSPVGMEIKGDQYGYTTYTSIQAIDSIIMFQPEPVMQPGVFEITREYFPYITETDSVSIIHFKSDIPLPLPVMGQKVVCNIFEEPLRNGFVGVVKSISNQGSEVVMECELKGVSIRDFYQSFYYCGKGGDTREEALAKQRIQQVQRIRRNIIVRAPEEDATKEHTVGTYKTIANPDLAFPLKYTIGNKSVPAQELPNNVPIHANGQGTGAFAGAELAINGNVEFLLTLLATGDDEHMGLEGHVTLGLTGKAGFTGTLQGVVPVYVGKAIEKELPGGTNVICALGLFLYGNATMEISAKLDGSLDAYFALQTIGVSGGAKASLGNIGGLNGSLKGTAAFRIGLMGEACIFGKNNEGSNFEAIFGAYNNAIQIDAVATADASLTVSTNNPADLESQYKTFADGNSLGRKTSGVFELEASKFSFKRELIIANVSEHAAPKSAGGINFDRYTDKHPEKLHLWLGNNGNYHFPAKIELWVWDDDEKNWCQKIELGETSFFEDFNYYTMVELQKGHKYSIYPVYKPKTSALIISDGAIIKSHYIQYVVDMEKPKAENHNKLTLKATHDAIGQENVECGFKIYKQGEPEESIVATSEINGSFEAEIDMPRVDYSVQAYVLVNGKLSVSQIHEMEGINVLEPILLEVTNIKHNSATLNMKLASEFLDVEDIDAWFTYAYGVTIPHHRKADFATYNDGVVSLDITDLLPMTEYTVGAYTQTNERSYEANNEIKFTTSAPFEDVKATPSYSSVDLEGTVVPGAYGDHTLVYCTIGKNKDLSDGTEVIASASSYNLTSGLNVTKHYDGLEMNTTYYYRMKIVMNHMDDESPIYYSDIYSFNTLDGYEITLSNATVKSNTATVEATVSQYIVDEVNRGNPYTIRFYYGTSSTKVKNRTSEFVEASISSTKVKATIKDLEEETKYYYAAVLYIIEEEGASEVKSFTTPTIFQIETKDAVVEDAMVTLKATISDAALAEMKSGNYNTIYPAFDLVTKEHESDLKQGTASTNVTRITDLTQDGVNLSVDVYLEPGTEYCFRSLIYVDGKEYYGSTKSFKTLDYDGGLIPLVRKYRTNASAPWVPIIVKPEERHLAIPLKELIKE